MKTRIITGAVMTAVIVPILIFAQTPLLPALVSFLSAIAMYEFAHCVGETKGVYIPLCVLAAAAPFAVRYLRIGALALMPLMLVGFLWIIVATVICASKRDAGNILVLGAGMVYVLCGLSLLVPLRDLYNIEYLLVIIIPVCSDVTAYFVGSAMGKHKLCPTLSPKKTVEGAVAGLVGSVVGTAIFGLVVTLCGNGFNFWFCAIALPAGALSQVGDLFASAVKRKYGIKDYGKLFPGHGGVLDRFDSVLPLNFMAMAIIIITELF